MSTSDQNPPPNDNKPKTESLSGLAARLEEKFGIVEDSKIQQEVKTRELGQSLKEEIADTTFIDVESFSKTRSRHVETKYGLKPMSDIIDPKTEEEKRKELEDYIRRNQMVPGTAMKTIQNKMANANAVIEQQMKEMKEMDESYPAIYSWFENFPGYRPEVNIGDKWANQITEHIKTETELSRAKKKGGGGYIYAAWKKGKMGIDKYLILFGVFGAILMPVYIYYRNKQYKEFVMAERGIKPGEEIDLENGRFELDDISNHRRFYVDHEERKKAMEKLSRKKEIKRLEQELYKKSETY